MCRFARKHDADYRKVRDVLLFYLKEIRAEKAAGQWR